MIMDIFSFPEMAAPKWRYSPWPEDWVIAGDTSHGQRKMAVDWVESTDQSSFSSDDAEGFGRYWWNTALTKWRHDVDGIVRDVPEPTLGEPLEGDGFDGGKLSSREVYFSAPDYGNEWERKVAHVEGKHLNDALSPSDVDNVGNENLKSLVENFAKMYADVAKWPPVLTTTPEASIASRAKDTDHNVDMDIQQPGTILPAGAPPTISFLPLEEKIKYLAENLPDVISQPGIAPFPMSTSTVNEEYLEEITNDFNLDRVRGNEQVVFGNSTDCQSAIIGISQWTYLYGLGLLVLTAVLFNVLSLVVLKTRAPRRHTYSTYLSILSIVDTLAILSQVPRCWMNLLYSAIGWGHWDTFYDRNFVGCKIVTYLSYVLRFTASWLVVALAADRLVQTLRAPKPTSSSGKKSCISTRMKVFFSIFFTSLAVNCHVLFTWTPVLEPGTDVYSCTPVIDSWVFSQGLTIGSVIGVVALPMATTAVLTGITLHHLDKWKKRARRLSTNALCRLRVERRVTVMSTLVTSTFCVLCIPYCCLWAVSFIQLFVQDTSRCDYLDTVAIRDITEVVFMVTYATKFLLCMLAGRNILNQKH